MTAPSLCLNFRALGRPLSLGRPLFRPSVHAGANECRSFAPVLFGLALRGRCIRVLHFEPIGGAVRTVGGVLALRGNAFEAELAGMGEDSRAVAFQMLVEAQAKAGFGQRASKRGLAHLQRITPQVVAVQFDKVEGVEEYAVVS